MKEDNKTEYLFGNKIPASVLKKAEKSKQSMIRKFGDDSERDYQALVMKNPYIGDMLGVSDILIGDPHKNAHYHTKEEYLSCNKGSEVPKPEEFDLERGLIVGNIRMGFGHYRISMAIASAAKSMGYHPYWMDLNSYYETTCTKVISAQNELYSLGSRLSQKGKLFNRFVWEPLNYEGFRKLSYNVKDQKNAELMAPVFRNIPKELPLVATHVWPAQAALHAGMKYVVNAIPDNWPMALHLAEGSLHTVQTHFAYQGYLTLNGMQGNDVLHPMGEKDLLYTGHYIDHELVSNIEEDCRRRVERKRKKQPMRFLLTIGGAGAQKEIFAAIIRYLIPAIREGKAVLFVNVGDYRTVWEQLLKEIPEMKAVAQEHFESFHETTDFAEKALEEEVSGIHGFYHKNIFEAVYCTNLLMRVCDVLVTKPSELAFYPVPKLFIKRVGGHEQWGAIDAAHVGDGTLECRDIPHTLQMIELLLNKSGLFENMCDCIIKNKEAGLYDGAYRVVEQAFLLRERQGA